MPTLKVPLFSNMLSISCMFPVHDNWDPGPGALA